MRGAASDSRRRHMPVPCHRFADIVRIFRIAIFSTQRSCGQRADGSSEPRMLLLRGGLYGGESARHWADAAGCGRNEARWQNLRRIVVFGRFGIFGRFMGLAGFMDDAIIGSTAYRRPLRGISLLASRFHPTVFLRCATASGKRGQRIAGDRVTRIILLDSRGHRITHRRASFSRS